MEPTEDVTPRRSRWRLWASTVAVGLAVVLVGTALVAVLWLLVVLLAGAF
jgi:hypothetical protein